MTIGEKIQLLRRQRGWSQERLAEALSVSRQALSRWEQGTAVPDTVNVQKLCRLFDVSADDLLDDARGAPGLLRQSVPTQSTVPAGLTARARRLLDEKGHVACCILAVECVPGLLLVGLICYAYLGTLARLAPLREFPMQAFIFPGIAAMAGVFLVIRIIFYLVLAVRLKRLQKEDARLTDDYRNGTAGK